MRHDPLLQFEAEAMVSDLAFEKIDAMLHAEAAEYGLELRSGHEKST